jgi:diguanylate cyclase (GGDEF)-like protein
MSLYDPSVSVLARLLELSCDWYWTLDEQCRMAQLDGRHLMTGPSTMLALLGKAPWEWPGVVVNDADFVKLRQALVRRQDLGDLHYAFRDQRGHLRYMALWGEPMFDAQCRFTGYRGTMREVTQRKRAEALVALEHQVTRSLAEAATSRKILQAVMRVICESEQWETAGYFRLEDARGTTRLVAGWSGPGMSEQAADYYRHTADKVISSGGLLSKVAASGQPLWVEAMKESQTTWAQRVHHTGERATLFFPVLVDGQAIGIFAFASREIREPDGDLLQTMRVIGEQVGQFLKRKQAEQVLRESEARFRALTELSSDWYWEIDTDFRFVRIEGADVERDGEAEAGSVIGKTRWETGLVCEDPGGWSAHREQLASRLPFRDLVLLQPLGKHGQRYISISGEPMHDHKGEFLGFRGIGRDITLSKLTENQIKHLATHDGLTGLPNRALFTEQIVLAIRLAKRSLRTLALLFIDLDDFKAINDAYGHDAGDFVLKEMAKRFAHCLRSSDVVARLGGDEFVALLQEVEDADNVAAIAKKILAAAACPMLLYGRPYQVTASIGVAMFAADAVDEQSLMRHADLAMYAAKQNGKNGIQFYANVDGSVPKLGLRGLLE